LSDSIGSNERPSREPPRWLTPLRADGIMLFAALIWGLGFIVQILGARHLGPLSFTGFRFGLAALMLVPFLVRNGVSRADVVGGLVAGTVMAVAAVLQQWGMGATTAANGGFITATYVIIAPFFATVLGQHVGWPVWCGVALVLPGLWFLSIEGDYAFHAGDPFVLACAVGWACHILLIGQWASRVSLINFACIQFAVTGALGLAFGLPIERPTMENVLAAGWAIVIAAIFPTVIAFMLQSVAQRVAPAAHSAILLSFEAVFAMIAGVVLLSEDVTNRKALGAALMFAGMVVAQRSAGGAPRKSTDADRQRSKLDVAPQPTPDRRAEERATD
jgi:drug/metabolite transporter (DMT)-like permease